MMIMCRSFSIVSRGRRRVICSLQELQDLQGKGLKFPIRSLESKQQSTQAADAEKVELTKPRRRRDLLTTGFVFFNEKTQEPRAFVNRCPHALLELDFDDSDFFCEGFIHCKAHAAFFDPETGICLQGPISSRKSLRGLDELQIVIDGENVVLLEDQSKEYTSSAAPYDSQGLETYKRTKQLELAEALSRRSELSEVEEMQQQLHEKTMARLKQYEQIDDFVRRK
ncbi:unnamed protein product [Peronospora belbahrii]|uniref:Rieske domain-containing protein n=1 Tax=Peronospora belbahrii TaxID=622444 RepID=A0AAU9KXL4_9STRA|nr:unnamed protein product [Peronospora belbahrii]CAH0521331.1 unnamed protein product [Peronospora belbahrii]